MAKITQKYHKNHKLQNFFKNNILSDSLPTKYTLQSHLKNLYMHCTVFCAVFNSAFIFVANFTTFPREVRVNF